MSRVDGLAVLTMVRRMQSSNPPHVLAMIELSKGAGTKVRRSPLQKCDPCCKGLHSIASGSMAVPADAIDVPDFGDALRTCEPLPVEGGIQRPARGILHRETFGDDGH